MRPGGTLPPVRPETPVDFAAWCLESYHAHPPRPAPNFAQMHPLTKPRTADRKRGRPSSDAFDLMVAWVVWAVAREKGLRVGRGSESDSESACDFVAEALNRLRSRWNSVREKYRRIGAPELPETVYKGATYWSVRNAYYKKIVETQASIRFNSLMKAAKRLADQAKPLSDADIFELCAENTHETADFSTRHRARTLKQSPHRSPKRRKPK